MSVRAKRGWKRNRVEHVEVCAADVMKSEHPLNPAYLRWLDRRESSKRKAREFLRENSHLTRIHS